MPRNAVLANTAVSASDRRLLAAWRVWAAAVRDRESPYNAVSDDLAGYAGSLARLMDSHERLRSRPPTDGPDAAAALAENIRALVYKLLDAGVSPPPEVAQVS